MRSIPCDIILDDPCRDTCHKTVIRNITCHDCTRSNDSIVSYSDPLKHNCSRPNPNMITNLYWGRKRSHFPNYYLVLIRIPNNNFRCDNNVIANCYLISAENATVIIDITAVH